MRAACPLISCVSESPSFSRLAMETIPDRFQHVRRWEKPYDLEKVTADVAELCRSQLHPLLAVRHRVSHATWRRALPLRRVGSNSSTAFCQAMISSSNQTRRSGLMQVPLAPGSPGRVEQCGVHDGAVKGYLPRAKSRLIIEPSRTQRRCAMWRMSNVQALIFVAAIVVMVALAVWWLAL